MPNALRHSILRPHGNVMIVTAAGSISRDTLRCCHCQRSWIVAPGSGRKRGFCTKCAGPTCGSHDCQTCLPAEKRIELYEQGKIQILR